MTSLSTGIKVIDDEHDRLIALEDRLRMEFAADGQSNVYNDVLYELVEYMANHFMHEETLMENLPAQARHAHKLEHAELSSRVIALMPSARNVRTVDRYSGNLADVISVWLREHIREWDMPLATSLLGTAQK